MRYFLISILILLGAAITDALSKPSRITCYAKAGLGVYDKHGVHEGYGENRREASAAAMADCRSQHALIGCIPVPGCK